MQIKDFLPWIRFREGGDMPYPDYWFIRIPLFVGQINIKPKRGRLFSERNGYRLGFCFAGLYVCWRYWYHD